MASSGADAFVTGAYLEGRARDHALARNAVRIPIASLSDGTLRTGAATIDVGFTAVQPAVVTRRNDARTCAAAGSAVRGFAAGSSRSAGRATVASAVDVGLVAVEHSIAAARSSADACNTVLALAVEVAVAWSATRTGEARASTIDIALIAVADAILAGTCRRRVAVAGRAGNKMKPDAERQRVLQGAERRRCPVSSAVGELDVRSEEVLDQFVVRELVEADCTVAVGVEERKQNRKFGRVGDDHLRDT